MNNNNVIVAFTRGGLCNNLKCYLSATRLAEQSNATLLTNCEDLCLLFSNLNYINTVDITDQMVIHCDWRLLIKDEDNLSAGFSRSRESRGFADADPLNRNIDFEYDHIPENIRQIYLQILSRLEIKASLINEANKFAEQFTTDTISIHMRTWMTDTWDKAPKRHAAFFNYENYKEIVERQLPGKIFLSSDNAEFASRLVNEYGSNILVYQPSGTLTYQAPEMALINLLLLSKNSRLHGSKLSTFTEMAWWYSGCRASVSLL